MQRVGEMFIRNGAAIRAVSPLFAQDFGRRFPASFSRKPAYLSARRRLCTHSYVNPVQQCVSLRDSPIGMIC